MRWPTPLAFCHLTAPNNRHGGGPIRRSISISYITYLRFLFTIENAVFIIRNESLNIPQT